MTRMLTLLATVWMLTATPARAADMPGAGDHPSIPRVAGSEILGYAHSDYDAGSFLTEDADGKVMVVRPEGRRTRILYVAKAGDTPLMVHRNYQAALGELGEVEGVYDCATTGCSGHMISTTLWTRDTMIPTPGLKNAFYLLGFSHNFTEPRYQYAQVAAGSSLYHVGVLSVSIASNNPNVEVRDRTVALLEVLEISDFSPTLEFVDATTMQAEMGRTGRVVLYGIQFDHDKATLRRESQATTDEIAKALAEDGSLSIYVVGHTDDVGSLGYNQDLSLRRAQTVVEALISRGVDAGRLTALGVGPAAPVASNDTEDGRALNRRVELVKRAPGT